MDADGSCEGGGKPRVPVDRDLSSVLVWTGMGPLRSNTVAVSTVYALPCAVSVGSGRLAAAVYPCEDTVGAGIWLCVWLGVLVQTGQCLLYASRAQDLSTSAQTCLVPMPRQCQAAPIAASQVPVRGTTAGRGLAENVAVPGQTWQAWMPVRRQIEAAIATKPPGWCPLSALGQQNTA